MASFKLDRLRGPEAKKFLKEVADLRIEVFREFPYLYEGSLDYEKKYLDRYFSSEKSLLLLLWEQNQLIGASTAVALEDEAPMIKESLGAKYPPEETIYFGESILKRNQRGKGYGKLFFAEREAFAQALGRKWCSFCAVIREPNDARRPKDYFDPALLWVKQGYEKVPGLLTEMSWQEIGESAESPKKMQFWVKKLG